MATISQVYLNPIVLTVTGPYIGARIYPTPRKELKIPEAK
jgi:hypothetical protein